MTKSVSSASTLVRGGQTAQHWWRMGWQVLRFATVIGAFIYISCFIFIVARAYNPSEMRIAMYYEMAERGVLDQNGFNKPYTFNDLGGNRITVDAVDLYRNTSYRIIRDGFFYTFHSAARISVIPAILFGVISLFIFIKTGNRIQEDEFVRGARLVSASQLKAWSADKWRKYRKKHKGRKTGNPLTISGIAFPPDAVEAQTVLNGTVGVGKTNAMIEMLTTIRENGGKVVIYDRMGGFVSRFYNEKTDVLINPFDNRSRSWNPFDDVLDAASFTQLGDVMIPEHRGAASDPFWSQAARIVFDYAARELYQTNRRTVKSLIDHLIRLDATELAKLLVGSPGAHFFNEEIIKTAQSIRANLISELRFLEYLRDDAEAFSIREWMASDESSFLFLTGDAEHAAATRNIISTMMEIAANSLMSMGPSSEPRCYFFLDEVPSLNRLPFLISSLAEIRQFGGAFVIGYQVYSQLEDIYGREAAQTISGTVNNRIVFNTPDFRTAKLCSESLGNQDKWESNTNISVGAHEARDGVGFTQQRVERPIISPAEIQSLPQHRAAVKFAYDSPTAFVDMREVFVDETQPRFLPYLGNAPGFGYYQPMPQNSPLSKEKPDPAVFDKFHQWCVWQFDCADVVFDDNATAPHPKYKVYFDHFRTSLKSGTKPENIHPIVLMDDGLVKNGHTADVVTYPNDDPPEWDEIHGHAYPPLEAYEDVASSSPSRKPAAKPPVTMDLFSHSGDGPQDAKPSEPATTTGKSPDCSEETPPHSDGWCPSNNRWET